MYTSGHTPNHTYTHKHTLNTDLCTFMHTETHVHTTHTNPHTNTSMFFYILLKYTSKDSKTRINSIHIDTKIHTYSDRFTQIHTNSKTLANTYT